MSSTYAGPASLPSSYAIISDRCLSYDHHDVNEDDVLLPRPRNPVMGVYPRDSQLSETTPLLVNSQPPVPRIEEQVDKDPSHTHDPMLVMIRGELVILTKYALPILASCILEYSLIVASVISVGRLSTMALAAISLGSMTANVTGFSIVQGLVSGLDTLLPPAWTSSEPRLVGLWTQRMTVVMAFAFIPIYIIWFNAEELLIFLKQDPDVAHFAAVYLRWTSIGLPAYAFNCISRRYFQSQGLIAVPTRIIAIVSPINVGLNYLLVLGPPAIRLGFIGAPIATVISFNLISIASIIYGVFYVPRTAWYPLSRHMFSGLGVLVQLGLSGVGQIASEWWAWEFISLAASLLGPVPLATQSVLLVSTSTIFQAPYALGIATSLRVGNLLGECKARRAAAATNSSLLMALMLAAFSSILFLTFRNQWAYMFNDDPKVLQLVRTILPTVALFHVFNANAVVTGGILRARGKQFTSALLNISAFYVIGIPFGFWLAFRWHIGLQGLWLGLTASIICCAVVGTYMSIRTNWDREVQKAAERLGKDEAKDHMNGENAYHF
ncbi:MATE efflux family protein [Amanita rubescens]|nr:MATE efflux family protein [Amanita rubescens]